MFQGVNDRWQRNGTRATGCRGMLKGRSRWYDHLSRGARGFDQTIPLPAGYLDCSPRRARPPRHSRRGRQAARPSSRDRDRQTEGLMAGPPARWPPRPARLFSAAYGVHKHGAAARRDCMRTPGPHRLARQGMPGPARLVARTAPRPDGRKARDRQQRPHVHARLRVGNPYQLLRGGALSANTPASAGAANSGVHLDECSLQPDLRVAAPDWRLWKIGGRIVSPGHLADQVLQVVRESLAAPVGDIRADRRSPPGGPPGSPQPAGPHRPERVAGVRHAIPMAPRYGGRHTVGEPAVSRRHQAFWTLARRPRSAGSCTPVPATRTQAARGHLRDRTHPRPPTDTAGWSSAPSRRGQPRRRIDVDFTESRRGGSAQGWAGQPTGATATGRGLDPAVATARLARKDRGIMGRRSEAWGSSPPHVSWWPRPRPAWTPNRIRRVLGTAVVVDVRGSETSSERISHFH